MMKYTTKNQNDLENPFALHVGAFDKAEINADSSQDPIRAGRRRIQSMCCSLSNAHEIAAPMASLYLLRESAFYSSADFSKVYVNAFVSALFTAHEELDIILHEDGNEGHFKPSSLYLDYVYRSLELQDTSVMEFVSRWEKRTNTKGLPLLPPHTQASTHSLHRRHHPTIPTVIGPRLPDISDPNLSGEELAIFQKKMLILFKPFRSQTDFPAEDNQIHDLFETWWANDSSLKARSFATNNADFYEARKLHKTSADAEVIRFEQYEDNEYLEERQNTATRTNGNVSSSDDDDDDDEADASTWFPRYTTNTRNIYQLERTKQVASLIARSSTNFESQAIPASSIDNLRDQIKIVEEAQGRQPPRQFPFSSTAPSTFRPTRVQLQEALRDAAEWQDPNLSSSQNQPDLQPNSSLRDASRHFRLNRKQHKAFIIVGGKLLRSFLSTSANDNQLCAFLGGLPGSGKSLVIEALQTLAFSWGHPYAIATVAYQGVAAQAAGGQTIHKTFGWGLKAKRKKAPTSQEQAERFAQLRLLIMDEISTTDVKFLGMIDAELRERKKLPNKLFGGVDFLLVGDWLQQLPTAGYPAYIASPPCSNRASGNENATDYLARSRGIEVYKRISVVIMLEENMRHRSDPRWRTILDRWRYGNYREEDIEYVNDVCYNQNWTAPDNNLHTFAPVIVTSNAIRAEFNTELTIEFCRFHGQILHQFPANTSRTRSSLSISQQRSLRSIRDDKTANMPLLLALAIGIPVQCTKNVSQAMKLANGSIGHVVDFKCASGDSSRTEMLEGIQYQIHTQPPDVVYIKLKDHSHTPLLTSLPTGIAPILARTEKGVKVDMTSRTFSITINQVPLIPAFAITSDKCQGLTVERMVLGPLRHSTRRNPQQSSFYVAVTRVKMMKQLYLMEPLSLDFLQYFKPNQDAIAETQRLQDMEAAAGSIFEQLYTNI